MYVICRVRKPSLPSHWPETCLLSGTLLPVHWRISHQVHISLWYGCFFLTYSNKMYYVTVRHLQLAWSYPRCFPLRNAYWGWSIPELGWKRISMVLLRVFSHKRAHTMLRFWGRHWLLNVAWVLVFFPIDRGAEHIFPKAHPLGSNPSLAQRLSLRPHQSHCCTFITVSNIVVTVFVHKKPGYLAILSVEHLNE